MRSPKLRASGLRSKPWYRYYAGYSPDFVTDVLQQLAVDPEQCVLDPWNGSGTTTAVTYESGRHAVGFDLNPALVIVAKGRLLGRESIESLRPLTDDLLNHAESQANPVATSVEEPLENWFGPETAAYIRAIERNIYRVLFDSTNTARLGQLTSLNKVSSLASYFYVALFATVRALITRFVGSNPTWVTVPSDGTPRAGFRRSTIAKAFREAQDQLAQHVQERPPADAMNIPPHIDVANSAQLPLPDSSVHFVLTSPPYCTRIDYAIATAPELAVLGVAGSTLRKLRDEMIGTPTITSRHRDPASNWGQSVGAFLDAVRSHPSKASAGYYLRYFSQYYASMKDSLLELRRVTGRDGKCILVVQDSYYKDIHVDLARQLSEMAALCGWTVHSQSDFEVPCTKAALNPRARKYRSSFKAKESVLTLA